MNQTALEAALEEATSEYLTHAAALQAVGAQRGRKLPGQISSIGTRPLASPSPLRLASPAPGWSETSKLVPIRQSDTEVAATPPSLPRTSDEVAVKTVQTIRFGKSDRLPSAGLSSATDSVRITLSGSPALDSIDSWRGLSSETSKTSLAAKSKARWALQDVYLNEYGEKVVNGEVVGQSIGGRRREGSTGARDKAEVSPLNNPNHLSKPSDPPAFFLQSYPSASTASLDTTTTATTDPSTTASSDVEEEESGIAGPRMTNLYSCPVETKSGPSGASMSKAPMGSGMPFTLTAACAVLSVSEAQVEPVKLHANRRLARQAGEADPDPLAHDRPTSLRKGNSAHYADEGVATEPFPADERDEPLRSARWLDTTAPLAQRTASLFYTPLVSQERPLPSRSSHSGMFEALSSSAGRKFASEPSSPVEGVQSLRDGDDNDSSSLDSLPTSLTSMPASNGTGSSTASRSITSHNSRDRLDSSGSQERGQGMGSVPHRRRSSSAQDRHQVFTASVVVKGWTEVGERNRGWIVFQVRIATRTGVSIALLRRFSTFITLRKQLLAELPDFRERMPKLPKKKVLKNHDPLYLEQRRSGLQRWLEVVMLDRHFGSSNALREWVLDR